MIHVAEVYVGEYYVAGNTEYQVTKLDLKKNLADYIENLRKGYLRGTMNIQEFANKMERAGRIS